ncbi:uncharacterized protein [Watersipora subatra]|uniref:uncharacterized protein n=1 Tax=Watersipora subatra TaxID=2589382 RepID=UPI00355B13BE
MKQLQGILAIILVVGVSHVGSLQGCYTIFELDICQEMQYGGWELSDFEEVVFATPADPLENCLNYKARTSCAVMVRAEPGQRIAVRTGKEYNLASGYYSSCDGRDSFTVDKKCVKPSLGKNRDVFLTSSFMAMVNFTSHKSHSEDESKALLSLRAFGCPFHTLVEGNGIDVQIVDESRLHISNNSYKVKVSCKNVNNAIRETGQKEMFINCTRRPETFEYFWDRMDKPLLTCSASNSTLAAALTVAIILMLVVLVILFILCYLRKFPCQRSDIEEAEEAEEGFTPLKKNKTRPCKRKAKKVKKYDDFESDADKEMMTSCHTIASNPEVLKETGDSQKVLDSAESQASLDAISQEKNPGNTNRIAGNGNHAQIAAEVSTHWNVPKNDEFSISVEVTYKQRALIS